MDLLHPYGRKQPHMEMSVNMLPCLLMPRRKALKGLHLEASERDEAFPDIVQALMDCQPLKILSINCPYMGWVLPELDLRHMAHLDECQLIGVLAPGILELSQGTGELMTFYDEVRAWVKLRHQLQNCRHDISIEAWSTGWLRAWAKGLDALPSLQFLEVNCLNVRPSGNHDIIDLADFAYIPHVSLRWRGNTTIKLSKGSWKILVLQSVSAFNVIFCDVEAFMRSTGLFFFKFPSKKKPIDLFMKMRTAGSKIKIPLHEYIHTYPNTESSPVKVLSNTKRESRFLGDEFF